MKGILKGGAKLLLKGKAWSTLRQWRKNLMHRRSVLEAYAHDRSQFEGFGSPARDFHRVESRLAFVVMLYHSLEKGLALPEPRAGFGRGKAENLISQLEVLADANCLDRRVYSAVNVMREWLDWQLTKSGEGDFLELRCRFDVLVERQKDLNYDGDDNWRVGGVREVTKKTHLGLLASSPENFLESRHSIRCFSDTSVDVEAISLAVRLAQTSPSLCNRQSCHVHMLSKGRKMSEALALQGGNNGFAEAVDKTLVVTSELGCFLSVGERNQCWVEGGLFSMALLLGLHAQGLGACCLNWAKEPEEDQRLHNLLEIPADQRVVMLIAVGHLPETFPITHSPRRPLGDIFHFSNDLK